MLHWQLKFISMHQNCLTVVFPLIMTRLSRFMSGCTSSGQGHKSAESLGSMVLDPTSFLSMTWKFWCRWSMHAVETGLYFFNNLERIIIASQFMVDGLSNWLFFMRSQLLKKLNLVQKKQVIIHFRPYRTLLFTVKTIILSWNYRESIMSVGYS